MPVRSLAYVSAVAVACCVGCSKNETPSNSSSVKTGAATTSASPPTDPAAIAANDFISAVVKGDTERATQLLTPQAIQQFAASGQRFAAPGLDSARFRIGQVRKLSDTQAVVQCLLSEKPADGDAAQQAKEQEMCCVMKLIDGQWRVSGIAVDTEQGQPVILNFEQPPQPQPPANNQFVEEPAAGATPPVRTAQEATPPPQR